MLRPDGRYLRTRAVAGRPVLRDSGTWEMRERARRLVLHDFPSTPTVFPVADDFLWATEVNRTITGAPRIMVVADRGLWYDRID